MNIKQISNSAMLAFLISILPSLIHPQTNFNEGIVGAPPAVVPTPPGGSDKTPGSDPAPIIDIPIEGIKVVTPVAPPSDVGDKKTSDEPIKIQGTPTQSWTWGMVGLHDDTDKKTSDEPIKIEGTPTQSWTWGMVGLKDDPPAQTTKTDEPKGPSFNSPGDLGLDEDNNDSSEEETLADLEIADENGDNWNTADWGDEGDELDSEEDYYDDILAEYRLDDPRISDVDLVSSEASIEDPAIQTSEPVPTDSPEAMLPQDLPSDQPNVEATPPADELLATVETPLAEPQNDVVTTPVETPPPPSTVTETPVAAEPSSNEDSWLKTFHENNDRYIK